MEQPEVDAIEEAYAEALKNLFNVMSMSFIAANGDAVKEQKAEQAFKAGLANARRVRQRALALLK